MKIKTLFKIFLSLVIVVFMATPATAGIIDRLYGIGWDTFPNGFLSIPYAVGTGATYSVPAKDAKATYRITGGSGDTTYVMSYVGTAISNKGKMFYIINSSSNSVTFRQKDAVGVTVTAGKIVTVVGNGTDFERVTADQ